MPKMVILEQLTKFVRRVFNTIGLWPLMYYDLPYPWKIGYRLLNWFMGTMLALTTIGEALYAVYNIHDLILVSESLTDVFGASICLAKFLIISWKREKLYQLLKDVDEVRSKKTTPDTSPALQDLEKQSLKEAQRVTLIMLVLIGGTIFFYNLSFLFGLLNATSYVLPYKSEYLFNWRRPIFYQILIGTQMVGGLNFICVFCAIPSLFANLAIFVCLEFETLKLGVSGLMEKGISSGDAIEILRKFVVHHQAIYRFCTDMESVFHPCVLYQLVLSGVTLSFVAFQLTQEGNDADKTFKYLAFFFLITGSLLLYCWYGEKIANESDSIGDCLYDLPWYNMSRQCRVMILQMIFRTQKTVFITASGFANATLATYTAVLKTSISYFALLRTVSEDK